MDSYKPAIQGPSTSSQKKPERKVWPGFEDDVLDVESTGPDDFFHEENLDLESPWELEPRAGSLSAGEEVSESEDSDEVDESSEEEEPEPEPERERLIIKLVACKKYGYRIAGRITDSSDESDESASEESEDEHESTSVNVDDEEEIMMTSSNGNTKREPEDNEAESKDNKRAKLDEQ